MITRTAELPFLGLRFVCPQRLRPQRLLSGFPQRLCPQRLPVCPQRLPQQLLSWTLQCSGGYLPTFLTSWMDLLTSQTSVGKCRFRRTELGMLSPELTSVDEFSVQPCFNGIILALGVGLLSDQQYGDASSHCRQLQSRIHRDYPGNDQRFTVLSHLARKMGWPVLTDSQTRLLEQG
jgi:hypothetical protein